jgi:hypothetical protein
MATITTVPPVKPAQQHKWISWKWTLIVSAVVVTFLMWQCGSALLKGRGMANPAVHHFHSLLNDGSYDQILGEADETFRTVQSPANTVNFLAAVHRKLGAAQSERLSNINVNATTNGTFVITTYQTTFDRGAAVETFTWIKSGNSLRLRGYNIQSNTLVVN